MTSLFTIDAAGNVHERARTPREERALKLHIARVYLREAQVRSGTRFAATLLGWASNARREALAIDVRPAQPDLFGSAAA